MILRQLSDCRIVNPHLTLGKDYEDLGTGGTANGVRIQTDDPELFAILLRSRFEPAPTPTPEGETPCAD